MDEVIDFLSNPNDAVRTEAVKIVKSYSTSTAHPELQSTKAIEALKALCKDPNPIIAHDAVSALINLSSESSKPKVSKTISEGDFMPFVISRLHIRNNVLSDLMLMLLSNITKNSSAVDALLDLKANNNSPVPGQGPLLSLVELFVKGEDKKWNPDASFDFLASVFSNVTSDVRARKILLSPFEDRTPLYELAVYTEHPSIIRRGGVASTIKNCLIERSYHPSVLKTILPRLLLPLCGPEEYDVDRALNMPEEIQLLPPSKQRETDPAIRLILLEALGLFATTYDGRKYMREVEVYEVLRVLHLAETVQANIVAIDRLVQLLMRDEAPDTLKDHHDDPPPEPEPDKGSDDEDFTVEEL